MSWDVLKVTGVCRLATDVELKYLSDGTAVANFSVAKGGKKKDSVSFFDVVAWGKTAENCSQYIGKGTQIAIDGELDQDRWQNQEGQNRSKVKIIAQRVQFLSKPGQSTTGGETGQQRATQGNKQGSGSQGNADFNDDFYDNTGFDPTPVDYDKMNPDDAPF